MAVVTKTLRTTVTNTSIVRSSNFSLVNTTTPHGFSSGDNVTVTGATPSSFNGTYVIGAVFNTTRFNYINNGIDESTTVHGTSGGDYTLMSTWESTEQTDLVTDGDSHVLECAAGTYDEGSSQLTILDWITGAANFITIKAAAGHEHGGVSGAGPVFTTSFNTTQYGFNVVQRYTEVRGLEVRNTATNFCWVMRFGTQDCVGESLIVKGVIPTNSSFCFGFNQAGNTLRNSLLISAKTGLYLDNYTGCVVENCTLVNQTDFGVNRIGSGSAHLTNCVVYVSSGSCFTGNTTTTGTNNASSDTTAIGTSPVTSIASTVFKDYAGGNYRPATDAALFGAGTDLSGTFTTDIRGETYAQWSIGAFDTGYVLRTLKASAGDYSLMSVWESTEQTDLVTASTDSHVLECDGFYCDDQLAVAGWTTSATYDITIKAAAGHEHNGIPRNDGGTGFILTTAAGGNTFVTSVDLNINVYDIQIEQRSSNRKALNSNYAGMVLRMYRCIISQARIRDGEYIAQIGGTGSSSTLRNCLIINRDEGGGKGIIYQSTGTHVMDACTIVVQFTPAVFGTTALTVTNSISIVQGGTASWNGSYAVASDYNGANGTDSPGANSVDNLSAADFVDLGRGDYRVLSDSGAATGVSQSGTYTDDIQNETRANWSMGAFDVLGVLKTLKSSLGDYSVIATWESTEQTALTTDDNFHILECDAFDLNGNVDIAGWTTDGHHDITVRAAVGHTHKGLSRNDGGLGFRLWSATAIPMTLAASHNLNVVDIELEQRELDWQQAFRAANQASTTILLDRCIFTMSTESGSNYLVRIYGTSSAATIRSCLLLNRAGGGSKGFALHVSGTHALYNCTMDCISTAADGSSTVTMINCVSANTGFVGSGTWHADSDYNADTTVNSPGANSVDNIVQADEFVDYTNQNLRPKTTGEIYGVGTDLGPLVPRDVRGELITEWSMGAFDDSIITRRLWNGGGDYTLLSTWESTEQTDLTVLTDSHVLECADGWGTGLVDPTTISGWTTDATYGITIRPKPPDDIGVRSGHDGTWLWNFGLKDNGAATLLTISSSYVTLEDFFIRGDSNNTIVLVITAANTTLSRMQFTSTNTDTVSIGSAANNCLMRNCIVRSETVGSALELNATATGVILQNNTFLSNATTPTLALIGSATDADIVNCAFYNNSTGSAYDTGTYSGTVNNNAVSDATALGTSGVTDIVSTDFWGYDPLYNSSDYRISAASALYNAGADLSGTFTDDNRSTATRTGATFDIGAYKFDVITKTLKASAGDYSLMSTWDTTEQTDLVTAGEAHVLECYNDFGASGLDDNCIVGGWVSDVVCGITIKAAAGQECDGAYNDPGRSFYLNYSGNATALGLYERGTTVQDIRINATYNGVGDTLYLNESDMTVQRCILERTSLNVSAFTLYYNQRYNIVIRNNLVIYNGSLGHAFLNLPRYAEEYIENNTFLSNSPDSETIDFDGTRTMLGTFKNNVVYNSSTGGALWSTVVTTTAPAITNAWSDATQPFPLDTAPQLSITSTDFVDYAGGNYAAKIGGALAGAGTDLSAEFDDDITGTAR